MSNHYGDILSDCVCYDWSTLYFSSSYPTISTVNREKKVEEHSSNHKQISIEKIPCLARFTAANSPTRSIHYFYAMTITSQETFPKRARFFFLKVMVKDYFLVYVLFVNTKMRNSQRLTFYHRESWLMALVVQLNSHTSFLVHSVEHRVLIATFPQTWQ